MEVNLVLTGEQMTALRDRVARYLYLDLAPQKSDDRRAPWQDVLWQNAADSVVKTVLTHLREQAEKDAENQIPCGGE